jgi:hypothetical protein
MSNLILILGADDPEMAAIEALALECGVPVRYAMMRGHRVTPATAYYDHDAIYSDFNTVVAVECEGNWTPDGTRRGAAHIRIDHHHPGDPGYGLPPADFLRGSSLGQVIALFAGRGLLPASWPVWQDADQAAEVCSGSFTLCWGDCGSVWIVSSPTDRYTGRVIPRELVLTAAADHCLEAAYRGSCPGVHRESLLEHRIQQRARHQGRDAAAIMSDVRAAIELLKAGPRECYVGSWMGDDEHARWPWYRDLRGQHVPELPEAACYCGTPYITNVTDRDGRIKTVLGAAQPELVQAFLDGEMIEGLTGLYGDPARGFAGGYLAIQPAEVVS